MVQGWIQIVVFCAVLTAIVPLLGGYMARVFSNERVFLTPVMGPLERLTYRLLRVDPESTQGWKAYAGSLLVFSGLFWFALYLILRTLALNRGRLLIHRAVLVEVWGPEYADDVQVLRVHMSNLRRKIGARYIHTDPGVGYRFTA